MGNITLNSKVQIKPYKNINGYYEDIKDIETSSTVYANGNTRKCVITHLYLRNSIGDQIGMKISGNSYGTEKINSKIHRKNIY